MPACRRRAGWNDERIDDDSAGVVFCSVRAAEFAQPLIRLAELA